MRHGGVERCWSRVGVWPCWSSRSRSRRVRQAPRRTVRPLVGLRFRAPDVSATPAASASGDAVTLNVWTLEGEEEFLPKIKDAFESSHPGTTLEFTVLPEDQYGTKVDTALAAGAPPDIAFVYDPRYIKQGHMVEVGDVLKERGVDLTRYAPGPLGPCTMDGKLYCIGTYTGALVLMYNKDLFDKAGIPYPSSTVPMTVDEYAARAKLSVGRRPGEAGLGGEAGPPTGGRTCLTSLARI